jgi:translation initiation factor IF-3
MLVIDPNGEKLGILSNAQALKTAEEYGLDLLLVSAHDNPPVARLVNYGKFRFESQKKQKEAKKNQKLVLIKEIQLTPQIGEHDFDTKVRQAAKFIDEGNKVNVRVRFKGRQMTHLELGEDIFKKFALELESVATVEKAPLLDGKWLNGILSPKKKS